jgi:hypothetical protein
MVTLTPTHVDKMAVNQAGINELKMDIKATKHSLDVRLHFVNLCLIFTALSFNFDTMTIILLIMIIIFLHSCDFFLNNFQIICTFCKATVLY